MSADKKLGEPVVLLDFSLASIRRQVPADAQDGRISRFLDTEPPGIAKGDYVLRRLTKACEAVVDDVARHGAVTYTTLETVRAALALARKN